MYDSTYDEWEAYSLLGSADPYATHTIGVGSWYDLRGRPYTALLKVCECGAMWRVSNNAAAADAECTCGRRLEGNPVGSWSSGVEVEAVQPSIVMRLNVLNPTRELYRRMRLRVRACGITGSHLGELCRGCDLTNRCGDAPHGIKSLGPDDVTRH